MNKTNAIAHNKYNKKCGCDNSLAGSKKENKPRLVGDILAEMLSCDSPLAKGYRKLLASKENEAEKGGEV